MRQRLFNYIYSIGASIVILGALFKLLKWPFADPMLIVGMVTEALVFFASAFDNPETFKEPQLERLERIKAASENREEEPFMPQVNTNVSVPVLPELPQIDPEEVTKAGVATQEYIRQLTELNATISRLQTSLQQNIQGLNAMYELQLRDAGSQLQSAGKVNEETQQMAKTIAELNAKYTRMLDAMK